MTAQTLLLTPWMMPHKIIPWQTAIVMSFLGKVDVLEEYDEDIRSPSVAIKAPAVVRLRRPLGGMKRGVKFSRINVFARDEFRCQYCSEVFPTPELTFDHVVPVSQGGRKDWENIVTCCVSCNRRKGGRTPAEARMHLVRPPRRPMSAPAIRITIGLRSAPESWRDYLYWNLELDKDDG